MHEVHSYFTKSCVLLTNITINKTIHYVFPYLSTTAYHNSCFQEQLMNGIIYTIPIHLIEIVNIDIYSLGLTLL